MKKRSAGLLMFRRRAGSFEVLLAHPGGPFWSRKDAGAWSLPKGEIGEGEESLAAARREFTEETGFTAPGPFIELGEAKQASGKVVAAWACEGDADPAAMVSNLFEMEWPPGSGKSAAFPEIDKVDWFAPPEALERIARGQRVFIERLAAHLASPAV
jgi:predicted NUDIX family NTP pyrophosphohydrolase